MQHLKIKQINCNIEQPTYLSKFVLQHSIDRGGLPIREAKTI